MPSFMIDMSMHMHKNIIWAIYFREIVLIGVIPSMKFKSAVPPYLMNRYCAVAPTVLAGQINPVLFEALYVSYSLKLWYVFLYLFVMLDKILQKFLHFSSFKGVQLNTIPLLMLVWKSWDWEIWEVIGT